MGKKKIAVLYTDEELLIDAIRHIIADYKQPDGFVTLTDTEVEYIEALLKNIPE